MRDKRQAERLLRTSEVAHFLQITPRSVRRLAAEGQLPHLRVSSKTLRYRQTEIEEWLKDR